VQPKYAKNSLEKSVGFCNRKTGVFAPNFTVKTVYYFGVFMSIIN
jgi:hypothetical protein